MPVTSEDILWLAQLARLDLNASEVEKLTGQMGVIIDYVSQLREVDVSGVEPLAHPLSLTDVLREDEPVPSLPIELALATAPRRIGDFYGVPPVLS